MGGSRGRWGAAVVCALVLVVTGCSSDRGDGPAVEGDGGIDEPVVAGEWTTFGYDLSNSRFNPDEAVLTPETAASLETVWEIDGITGVSSTPAVLDGVVYLGDWAGVVHALDAASGEPLWTTEIGSQVMSSVTIDGDALFVANLRTLYRLDRASGEVEWELEISDHPIAITPSAPTVVDGLVLVGIASGELMIPRDEYTFRGSVVAVDTETGEETWRFWTTPGDETGGAGVGVWSTASVDTELGLAYVGTGNTYAPPAAPLSDSLVALDVATGELAWSAQFTYPDVWSAGQAEGVDGDVGSGPNLWEADDGRAMVGVGDKRGVYHALDRTTGELVWETEMTPGSLLGGVIGTSAVADGTIYVGSNVGDPANNGPTGTTEVLALDADDGEVLWRHGLDGAVYASITVVPGVVLAASTSGEMVALAADDGDELWSMTAPDQVGSGPSVVDGTVYWGYGFSLFGSGAGLGGMYALRPGGAPAASGGGGEDESEAARLYRTSCASCHGPRGGGGVGPSLVGVEDRLGRDEHIAVVVDGTSSQMPGFGDVLSTEEIEAIVDYERSGFEG